MSQRLHRSSVRFKDITDPKKFACYAGVVPFEQSSGRKRTGPISMVYARERG
ncbi:transposase [Spirosoma linguale]|uniref:transposase n=1 Tax=Spirosoma linguale TaxID=108 RepID=UPI003CC7F5FA